MFKNGRRHLFLCDVLRVVDKKNLERDRQLDASSRQMEQVQEPYDHGPGYVAHRPKDATLH